MSTATQQSAKWDSSLAWGDSNRYFESAEQNRLNSAHWARAQDESINAWISGQLSIIRARAHYECKQNGMLAGMVNTHADDVVGQDGPSLQVISDDDQYNEALEQVWREWFRSPTPDPEVSGAELLKDWVKSLWTSGEWIDQIVTDPAAEGDVSLRLLPKHPRLLASPAEYAIDDNVFMGIRINSLRRPTQYYLFDESLAGLSLSQTGTPVPADLVIHKFVRFERGQLRGIPWLNTALSPSADLRDYDDQVQDAARQIADQNGILYTDRDDIATWQTPESINVQRRTIKTAPPGWKPFVYPNSQPPVQYPDYRAERQREFGRPAGMPLAMIRLDFQKYNYSSGRLETQNYQRAVASLQNWISGTPRSVGVLTRLTELIASEARFRIGALRKRPPRVTYQWTWPQRPHVDPTKEANAEGTSLANGTTTLIDALANRGEDLDRHIEKQQRVLKAYEDAGLALPEWAAPLAIDQAMEDLVSELEDAKQ